MSIIKINLKGKDLRPLILVAVFSPCIYFIGETVGINHTTAAESGDHKTLLEKQGFYADSMAIARRTG